MLLRTITLCVLLSGCGTMGLDLLSGDSGSLDGNSWLVVDPQNGLNFGEVDVQGSPAIDTLILTAKGADQVVIIDIRTSELTWSNFYLGSEGLPLPHMLPANREYPIDVYFAPTHTDEYTGSLEIDIENEEGGVDTEEVGLVGRGCDSSGVPACP